MAIIICDIDKCGNDASVFNNAVLASVYTPKSHKHEACFELMHIDICEECNQQVLNREKCIRMIERDNINAFILGGVEDEL